MRVVVTNDDGFESPGIQILAAELARDGRYEVVVVAPATDRSGTGASLGQFPPDPNMAAHLVDLPHAPGVEAWALDATPAMCTLSALLGGFGERPDMVISGVNAGMNTGRAILHSGTVGAVMTAQNFGLSGLAVSTQWAEEFQWETAARVTIEVLEMMERAPAHSVLNLNVPALVRDEMRGVRWGRLAPMGGIQASMVGTDLDGESRRRGLKMDVTFIEETVDPHSDQGLVEAGWASLTALVGVAEAWPVDGPSVISSSGGNGSRASGSRIAGSGVAGSGVVAEGSSHLSDAEQADIEPADIEPADVESVESSRLFVPGADLHPAHDVPDASSHGVLRRPIVTL